jgi:predicted SnoaL-like aldol condensation-catalyzing enzyme
MTITETVLNAFSALFIQFEPEAANVLLAPDYIQHNPSVPTGAAAIVGFVPVIQQSGMTATTHRVISEGDLVVMHNTFDNAKAFGAETLVAFDVFRVEDGKVVEHWDNLQPLAGPNPSGRSMTDGATEIVDLDKTAENKALVSAFVSDVLHGKAPEKNGDYISAESYAQHNPQIGDGLEGLGGALQMMAEAGIEMRYDATHMIVAEGNFVFAASEGVLGEAHTAFFDLFRVEDGKIVEHWDTVSKIPAEMAHDNGKFYCERAVLLAPPFEFERVFRFVSVQLARWCQHCGLTCEDFLALDHAGAIEFHAAFADIDVGHGHRGHHGVIRAHRGEEFQRLAHVDGAVARQLLANHCGDQAGGEHAVGDAATKHGVLGVFLIQMHGVVVGGHGGEHFDVLIGHGFAHVAAYADLEIFDEDGAARQIVQHVALRILDWLCN